MTTSSWEDKVVHSNLSGFFFGTETVLTASALGRSELECIYRQVMNFIKQAAFVWCKDKHSSFCIFFCVSYSVGGVWELKSGTDCVYTISSALGNACHGANALCWLCVWHSYITNTSHWGPQRRDCLCVCRPASSTEMGELLKTTSGLLLTPFFCVPRWCLK